MARNYISDPKNLFTNDDDVDDDMFLKNSRRNVPAPTPTYSDPVDRLELQRQKLLEKKREIEEQTVNSTQRSLGLLRNSEQVGIATAEELMRQREQLENTDKRLDEINATLRFSQKHLNGIKSIFGGLKNYLSGKNDSASVPPSQSSSAGTSSTRRNTNPFLEDSAPARDTNPFTQSNSDHYLTRMKNNDLMDDTRGNDPQSVIDRNLQEMLSGVTRLKGLASGLGEEIESQNYLIDDINDKASRADITIGRQNKDLAKILKK